MFAPLLIDYYVSNYIVMYKGGSKDFGVGILNPFYAHYESHNVRGERYEKNVIFVRYS